MVIFRCHYYGPRIGRWELASDDGEVTTFETRDEAVRAINESGFAFMSRSEYARDYKVVEATVDAEVIHVERRGPQLST